MNAPITPYGGELCQLFVADEESQGIKAESIAYTSLELSAPQLCDLELLLVGAFSPLRGFMGRADYEAVLEHMRLADGTVWPMPIMLSVPLDRAEAIPEGGWVALRDAEGVMLARMWVQERWQPDLRREAQAVFGTLDPAHPGVARLLGQGQVAYLGGPIEGLEPPAHHDFRNLRRTPAELRHEFTRMGWRKVVAFQTRNPMHRAHKELTVRAASSAGANLLLHPVVGLTKPGDIDHYARVRCYQAIARSYPPGLMMLSLLPLAMRMGGPREALWHAIIRRNYGCTHFIVGRDHAGPGVDGAGRPFYDPYAAQELVQQYQDEIGIQMVPFQELVYVPARAQYMPQDEVPDGCEVASISGTELRRRMREGLDIPSWFTYPEVVAELRRLHPPRTEIGITLFFTGLSGAGKSTVANVLLAWFLELGQRPVTLLDGDIVRKNLSSELGFSRAHRDLNILRIGFVANEITKNGGIALCAPIAPYAAARRAVRELVSQHGAFIEIHVATPVDVCEQRDRKGLYAKARAGLIKQFTGVSDPYEAPEHAELVLDTTELTPEQAAQEVWLYLEREGYFA